MKRITAWRRRPWAGYAVVLVALAAIAAVYAGFSPQLTQAEATDSAASAAQADDLDNGRRLFSQNCASCHGTDLQGARDSSGKQVAPSLVGVGGAAVDFQVATGRMPAMNTEGQNPSKAVIEAFDQDTAEGRKNLQDLIAYVSSVGGGPQVPAPETVDPESGDPGKGGMLFRTNCAQCHNFVGSGGALTGGKYAPELEGVSPRHIYEAMITGPDAMPVFNDSTFTPEDKRDIIAYITQTNAEPNPGGFGLGRIGPVSEGLVGWLVGLSLMVMAAMWITAKKPKKLKKQHD